MVAVEFVNPATGEPDADFTKRVQARALERGLLLLVCGVYSNVVRFLFPLTIRRPCSTKRSRSSRKC
jgi:4-aminobutyrate aminotransferase